MRILAWVSRALAAVWIVLAVFGAENFPELYGGTSGAQFFLPALAHRRGARPPRPVGIPALDETRRRNLISATLRSAS